jgi:uncharacterized membrane protein
VRWRQARGAIEERVLRAASAMTATETLAPEAARAQRNHAIDWLRGVVMVVMALDHARAFVGTSVDLATATPALFFTRWITHFCAPVFVLLAGTAAYLHGRRLASPGALARWLATRGVWLVVLEVTVVRAAWIFYLGPDVLVLQVIWAIGMSMLGLAALVWLPLPRIAVVALAVMAGHDLLDGVGADAVGVPRWLWLILHQPGPLVPFEGAQWLVIYPLIPWVAVMALGYALGPWMTLPQEERRARFLLLGVATTVGFLALRAANVYGDPRPWNAAAEPLRAVLSFLDCEKYPPSLLFLAMTLGPALVLLAAVDRPLGAWSRRVAVFGRVPLYYYVLHLLLIHLIAVALAWPTLGPAAVAHPFIMTGGLGRPLWVVYAVWMVAVLVLYPACRWFADVKRRSDAVWLSYL